MLEFIISLDTQLFYFFNGKLINPILDTLMPFITDLDNWKIPIILFWLYLMIRGGRKGRVAGLLIIPVIALTDQVSASVIKPWVGRIRPCYALENVRLLVDGCGGKLAFPSSHATNIAGFAMLFSLFYRKQSWIFIAIAFFIGYSRVYVGKHYPGDVMFGWILGAVLGYLVYRIYVRVAEKYPGIRYQDN